MNIDKICELATELIQTNSQIKEMREKLKFSWRSGKTLEYFMGVGVTVDDDDIISIWNALIDLKSKRLASLIVELGNEINKEDMGG